MNRMKEIAQVLGVELGEEFNISSFRHKYRFTSNGLETQNPVSGEWEIPLNGLFLDLVTGEFEIEKSILDKEEKEYLECVIKPFKDRVEYIAKCKEIFNGDLGYIMISVKDDYSIFFPRFKIDSMYRNMEPDKLYSLGELELFKDEQE